MKKNEKIPTDSSGSHFGARQKTNYFLKIGQHVKPILYIRLCIFLAFGSENTSDFFSLGTFQGFVTTKVITF